MRVLVLKFTSKNIINPEILRTFHLSSLNQHPGQRFRYGLSDNHILHAKVLALNICMQHVSGKFRGSSEIIRNRPNKKCSVTIDCSFFHDHNKRAAKDELLSQRHELSFY